MLSRRRCQCRFIGRNNGLPLDCPTQAPGCHPRIARRLKLAGALPMRLIHEMRVSTSRPSARWCERASTGERRDSSPCSAERVLDALEPPKKVKDAEVCAHHILQCSMQSLVPRQRAACNMRQIKVERLTVHAHPIPAWLGAEAAAIAAANPCVRTTPTQNARVHTHKLIRERTHARTHARARMGVMPV